MAAEAIIHPSINQSTMDSTRIDEHNRDEKIDKADTRRGQLLQRHSICGQCLDPFSLTIQRHRISDGFAIISFYLSLDDNINLSGQ